MSNVSTLSGIYNTLLYKNNNNNYNNTVFIYTLKSCKGYRGAGGFRLRLSEQVYFEVFFKGVCSMARSNVRQQRVQGCGAASKSHFSWSIKV